MKRRIRQFLRKNWFYPYLQSLSNKWNYRNQADELIYVHIGKCGGVSLWDAINRSPVISNQFTSVSKVHVAQPPVLTNSKYLIVVRNPISRAVSAFNWRYKLVVDDATMKDRFPGEYGILKKYGSLNSLAEALYQDGQLNNEAAADYRSIHHLKEDITHYVGGLLKTIRPDQLFAVLTTEFLDDDINNELQIQEVKRVHENSSSVDKEKKKLSDQAHQNLRRFLSDDYAAVKKLFELKGITNIERLGILDR